jgi:hypothetical protein
VRNPGMIRRPLATVLASLVGLALLAVAPVATAPVAGGAGAAPSAVGDTPDHYTPTTGALFNNPLGSEAQQRTLFTHIIRTINSVPSKGTIRIAVFSFADKRAADALLSAYARGVHVKLIFSGSNIYPPMTRLRNVIGADPTNDSFVVFCNKSCRGTEGQMHAKFFAFSSAGDARNITMVGSNNMTNHNAQDQWSDLYTVANGARYYWAFRPWFRQLKFDQPVEDPYITRDVGTNDVDITPIDLARESDPIMQALEKVTCETRSGDIDPASETPDTMVSTRILVAAHAWNGERGKTVAKEVAALSNAGCTVRVFYGIGVGPAVRNILTSAGAVMTNGTHRGVFTHEKMMIVNGNFDGDPSTVRVWTGSHNWSSRAVGRDDLIVQVNNEVVGQQYVLNFWKMWHMG